MKRLRVVHIVNSLACGGLEQLVCQLSARRGGQSTAVLCLFEEGELGEQLEAAGVDVQVAGAGRLGSVQLLPRVVRILRRYRPHVVHCHNLPALTFGGLAARRLRVPGLVFTKHGASRPGRGRADRLRRWLCRRAEIVAVSPEIQQLLETWIADQRTPTHFIPNGIDLGNFEKPWDREAVRSAHRWANDFLITIVARLTPEKDHATLFKAFRKVASALPAARLLVVGDGPLREVLVDQARTLRLKNRIEFLGNRCDIPQLLTASDLFTLSSQTEGIPLGILEAMAAGLPVLATRVGGIPSVIEHRRSGWLVDAGAPDQLADAILHLARDRREAGLLAEAGRRTVAKRFDLDGTVEAYEAIYHSATAAQRVVPRPALLSLSRSTASRLRDIRLP